MDTDSAKATQQPPAACDTQVRVSIVVPTYNECENLPLLAERVFAAMPAESTELVIVDDNSPDGTAKVASELSASYPIRCLVRTEERGLSTAVIHGLRHAWGERCVVMDADLSHPPESIPDLVRALDTPETQVAIGSRFVDGGKVDLHWPMHRRILSKCGRLLAWPLTGVRDTMSGFFCVRRAQVDLARLSPTGYKILLELLVRLDIKHAVEVPITFMDRAHGETKLSTGEQVRYLRHLSRLYWSALTGA